MFSLWQISDESNCESDPEQLEDPATHNLFSKTGRKADHDAQLMGRGGPSSNLKIQRRVMESNNPSLTEREEEIARLMQHLGNDHKFKPCMLPLDWIVQRKYEIS